MTPSVIDTDVLVIGGGLAGVRAALSARSRGASACLVLKGRLGYCGNSAGATGGFAAAVAEDDSPASFAADTIAGGFGINDPDLVHLVCQEAHVALAELADMGFEFPVTTGSFDGMPVPGHSVPRSVRYAGGGMWHLMRGMREKVAAAGIDLLEDHRAADLVVLPDGAVAGALLLDSNTGQAVACHAGAVVLATGGCGQIYPITTNKRDVTGDGYALALRAGCALRDMEFIQFTPTAFAGPESLRGLTLGGALLAQDDVRLLNGRGERFLERYAPDHLERAVRSVIARAIHREVEAGRGTSHGGVFMDLTALPEARIEQLKPGLIELCRQHGIDPTREPLETGNSAHHCVGGIAAGSSLSPRPGLFVAGEALGGLHGANRLSSNSLSEANVTGRLAGLRAAEHAHGRPRMALQPSDFEARIQLLPASGGGEVSPDGIELKTLMGRHAGVERNRDGLAEAAAALRDMADAHRECGEAGVADVGAWLDRRAMLLVSQCIVASARLRQESRGAHYRWDFPETREREWLGNTFVRFGDDGLAATFRPLRKAA